MRREDVPSQQHPPLYRVESQKKRREEERGERRVSTRSKKSAHERACAAPGGEAHAQRSSRGGGRCEENMRTVTYALRVALRGRPLRSGASTVVGARTTRVAAAYVEVGTAKRLARIPDQPRRLHDAGQHGHHQHPHDLPPCRPAASHAAHRVPLRLSRVR